MVEVIESKGGSANYRFAKATRVGPIDHRRSVSAKGETVVNGLNGLIWSYLVLTGHKKEHRQMERNRTRVPGSRRSKRDRDRLIQTISSRLQDPNLPGRELKSLSHELGLLTGAIQTYKNRPKAEPEPEPDDIRNDRELRQYEAQERAFAYDPKTIRLWRIYVIERLAQGIPLTTAMQTMLDRQPPEVQAQFHGEAVRQFNELNQCIDSEMKERREKQELIEQMVQRQFRRMEAANDVAPVPVPHVVAEDPNPTQPARVSAQQLADFYAIQNLP